MSTIHASGYPPHAVLEGVPRIGYHIHCCPFPGALMACMQYLGTPSSYDYLMGVTGAAFRRFWNRGDGGNVDSMYLAPDLYQRAFRALGYSYRIIPNDDKAAMIRAIQETVARGIPAISFGIIGPPEAGLVTGYGRDGEVLYGYSYFQDTSLPGYYEKEDWFQVVNQIGPYGLILVGEKQPRPAEREILVSTLAWAIDVERTSPRPGVPGHSCGLDAYEDWAKGMEVDADYPADDPEVLGWRVMIHGDQATMLDERRHAAGYLRSMAAVAPEAAAHLDAAAALYDETAGYESGVWLWGYSMGPEVGRALVDPEIRRSIARYIRIARDSEARAVEYLERALVALQ